MDKGYVSFVVLMSVLAVVLLVVSVFFVQFLWNSCVSPLGVPQVGYFQTLGLFLLSRVLFGSVEYK